MEPVLGSMNFGECTSRALRIQLYPKCDFFPSFSISHLAYYYQEKMFLWQILVPSAGLGQTLAPQGIVITLQRIKMEKAVTERAPVAVCIPGNAAVCMGAHGKSDEPISCELLRETQTFPSGQQPCSDLLSVLVSACSCSLHQLPLSLTEYHSQGPSSIIAFSLNRVLFPLSPLLFLEGLLAFQNTYRC